MRGLVSPSPPPRREGLPRPLGNPSSSSGHRVVSCLRRPPRAPSEWSSSRSDRDVEQRIQLNVYLLEVKEIRLSMTRARSKDYPYAYCTHIDSSPAGRQGCGLHHRQKSLLLYQMMRTYTTLTPPSSPPPLRPPRRRVVVRSFLRGMDWWVRKYDCIHTYIHTFTST